MWFIYTVMDSYIIKESKTSSGLYCVGQDFALLHLVRRHGEIYFSIPKCTKEVNMIKQL